MSDDSCCYKGSVHEGEPIGEIIKVASLDTYFVKAKDQTTSTVLFLHDAFGLPFINNKLLADTYAREANVNVYLPDLFEGDPVPEWYLNRREDFDIQAWSARHSKDHVYPLVLNVIKELKEKQNISKIVTIGFCYGGWISTKLGGTDLVVAIVNAHPSRIDFPTDIENLKKPSLFLCAEIDQMFTQEMREKSQDILSEKKEERIFRLYPGASHGFAVRHQKDEVNTKAAENAKDEAVAFFKKYLH